MNPAETATCQLVEDTLKTSSAFQKISDGLFTVKQGSSIVIIHVVPWGNDKAVVRCFAQLARGVKLTGQLAADLLELNAFLRFGGFAWVRKSQTVTYMHSILGGATLDREELLATVRDVAVLADEYDDKIVDKFGGQRMRDRMNDTTLEELVKDAVTPVKF